MDGSQKIPQRWLETLAAQAAQGRECPAIRMALAAWLRHLRGDNAAKWGPVDDPRAEELAKAWAQFGATGIVPALFGPKGLVSAIWTPSAADKRAIGEALG